MLGAVAEQQAILTPRYALFRQPVDKQLALAGLARLLVVAEQGVEIPAGQLFQHGADDGGPIQLHRQVLPQLDAMSLLLADHPGVGRILIVPLDPGPVPHPGGQQAAPLCLAIGAGDGANRHPQPVRQRPVGGQAGLRRQGAVGYVALDGLDQLEVEGAVEGCDVRGPDCHGDNKSIDRNVSAI